MEEIESPEPTSWNWGVDCWRKGKLDWGRQTLGFWFTSSLRTCLNRKRGALETPRSLKKAWNPQIGSPLLWAENRSFRSSEDTSLQLHTTSKMHRVMASGWQINLRRSLWVSWAWMWYIRVPRVPGTVGREHSHAETAISHQADYFSKALVTADIKIRKHGQIPRCLWGLERIVPTG